MSHRQILDTGAQVCFNGGMTAYTLNITPEQADLLAENLDQAWRISINHLVSSVQAQTENPDGEWAKMAPSLANRVDNNRMLVLQVQRMLGNAEATS